MNFELPQEHKTLQKMVHDLVEQELMPYVADWDKRRYFPVEFYQRMAEVGLMGLLIPEEYGGSGMDTLAYVVAMEEIARGDLGVGLSWGGHMTLGTMPFLLFGNETQKERYLPRLASGEYLGAFGLTEPNAGSDAGGIETRATLDNGEWIINGSKCFISNTGTPISYGGVFLVVTGVKPDGKKEFSNIIVERGTPGYSVGPNYEKMGWHLGDTREQIFENCRVLGENLIGDRGAGLRQALTTIDVGRIGFAASSLGVARAAYEEALAHAKTRVQFGRPLSKFQAIQFKLAEMHTKIEGARALTYKAAALRDAGKPFSTEAAVAKLFACRAAVEAVDEGFQIFGGYGFMKEYPISRLYRDVKMMEIGEGTTEMQKIIIARALGC